jgi:hypothetical protein
MDPTYQLCRVYDSFTERAPSLDIPWYTHQLDSVIATETPKPLVGGVDRSSVIGRSVFLDYSGVILANIDVLNVTTYWGGMLAQQTLGPLTYCSIGGAPGGWIDYIQWRRPEAYGYVIVPKEEELSPSLIFDRFTVHYGQDNTGRIDTNSESFASYVRGIEIPGVDLALCQVTGKAALTSSLLCLKKGGNCVISYTDPQLLYFMALSFAKVTLFRPLADSTKAYCVGIGYLDNRPEYPTALSASFVSWFNSLQLPDYPINTYRAKAVWNIPDTSPPLTGIVMSY